jgi:hypothetical protein
VRAAALALPAFPALLVSLALALAACAADGGDGCPRDDTAPGDAGAPRRDAVAGVDARSDARSDAARADAGADAGPVEPRTFGAPCADNDDCDSAWCVPYDDGFVCSQTCIGGCPNGWECRGIPQTSPDVVFVCYPPNSHLCQPCVGDFECGDGFCLVVGDDPDQRHCGRPCSADLPCPASYTCLPSRSAEGDFAADMCVPDSGRCDCTLDNDGQTRACSAENENGVCWGVETCDAARGWTGCSARPPQPEDCNGLDDDCDGVADESPTPPAEPCQRTIAGVGTCPGAWTCRAAAGWACEAPAPAPEACNGLDDDCDGDTDEDFLDAGGRVVHPDHCGSCGARCAGTVPHGETHCVLVDGAPACVLASCAPGWYPVAGGCAPALDRLCQPCQGDGDCGAPGDRCLALDAGAGFCGRDCAADNLHGFPAGACPAGYGCEDRGADGRQCVPESGSCTCRRADDGATRGCLVRNDHGLCLGVERCVAATGWSACDARVPVPETCNGVDDDCSGVPDDLPGRYEPCANTNEHGSCAGVRDCQAGAAALVCRAPVPRPERCDYTDDDCDGATDETFPTLYEGCAVGVGQCRRFGVTVCAADGLDVTCSVGAGAPADESCNGLDDDCDGGTDEEPHWAGRGTPCTAGRGQCEQHGVWVCDPADPAGPVVCSATPRPAGVEVCDGADNDCDGTTDEGWLTPDGAGGGAYRGDTACGNCYTDCTAIYDRPGAFGTCCAPDDPQPCDPPVCRMGCDPDRFDLNLVPDDGCEFALDAGAIHVSVGDPDADDRPGCGAAPAQTGRGRPCRSIARGLQEAVAAGRQRVLVADGLYEESVTLVAGVSLLGGYRPDTWERHRDSTLTVLRGADSGTHRTTVFGRDIRFAAAGGAETVFEGFVVYGANATAAGGNAHALFFVNCDASLVVRHAVLWAGTGAPGASGAGGIAGARGGDGAVGAATVSTRCEPGETLGDGGAGAAGSCLDPATASPAVPDTRTDTSGGRGGAAVCPDRGIQAGAGAAGRGPQGGGGAGGAGGWGHSTSQEGCSVTPGQPELGADGGDGAGGAALDGAGGAGCADPFGGAAGTEWRGAAGGAGAHGAHGAGGGGGGAGSGQKLTTVDPPVFDVGGRGGGGGAGGCPGAAGEGGGAGGGSFAVLVVYTAGQPPFTAADVPRIEDNWIRRNLGGPGGAGGAGGTGGEGGRGGAGGAVGEHTGPIYCVFPGARGGVGGRGGHGGGGGGGCGGVSFDMAAFGLNGVRPDWQSRNVFAIAAPIATGGAPGVGGASQNTDDGAGGAGVAGASGVLLVRD